MSRQFSITTARREAVPLLIALTGPSGSGKTTSALRLATGIQSVVGGDIALIDTENRRALHYADKFNFKHVQFDPPFGSLDYLEALEQTAKSGAKVIIVDSASHEHSALGGMLDYHETELDRMAGNDYAKRERMTMLAWQKPKADRRKLLQGITRLDAHVILCFRARETSRPVKVDGKTKIVEMGFMPEAGPEFVYECALSAMFLPGADGVPSWHPENPGERQAVKLPMQFRWLENHKGAMDENIGKQLAEWARGGVKGATQKDSSSPDILETARAESKKGRDSFTTYYKSLTPADKKALEAIMPELKDNMTNHDKETT